MLEKRNHPRYSVRSLVDFKCAVRTPGGEILTVQLVTFAFGGCGFLASENLFSKMPSPIQCLFSWDELLDRPLEIAGNLLYADKENGQKGTTFYGVQFN